MKYKDRLKQIWTEERLTNYMRSNGNRYVFKQGRINLPNTKKTPEDYETDNHLRHL